ncbi:MULTISPECIES: NAD(P)-dependent malic enzyme [Prauserella salsuginis group]|uniref:Malate dehydrogenase (Oxaloacetate-decarboxylating) n=2 Tax=Prauserella salsuginis group TaxID=2893672 RepID=A0A839XNM0_9PSEU|nr:MULTISPECIES: NADP-dependent malic enzyme [Prauserella salsuginis group]MBB3665442.1 malate dehydrogenase (oxaloacetate-decarboxylating) [Prauserella sediminis]MCR3718725.1 malate dehydrogenase (oxaloacetate-decarboxylating) [Prauserella flava]MCR3733295.1 malate dehydrogenase (oxaloacetate-decarboxylating) [Prauserella salsuginis]
MTQPSPGHSITLRVATPAGPSSATDLVAAVADAGAALTAFDVVEAAQNELLVDITCDTLGAEHAAEVASVLSALEGVTVKKSSDRTFLVHLGGKLESTPKAPIRTRDDLSRAYTPGVARVCRAIAANPADARRLTIKRNTVAVVTDGSAVLGLGDIGPEASMPVMEGKAVLFKEFAGVDAWPVPLNARDTEQIITICKALAPAYGGINLEDIAAPRCFEIEARLREELDIPVFHDDQHGTAIVTLAALRNALKVVTKRLDDVRIVISGAGAAGHAIAKLLQAAGARDIVVCGRSGVLDPRAEYADAHRGWLATHTNPEGVTGTLKEAVVGADVFIGVSAPDLLDGADIAAMASDAVVFAMSNPDPEVDPAVAGRTAAVVATGRSDYPNQINNVLAFPGFFRGLLDAGASDITDDMLVAAAEAIAGCISGEALNPHHIIPTVFEHGVAERVAAAVAEAARRDAVAARSAAKVVEDHAPVVAEGASA